ncbi:MAG: signal peptide peptidase SppA [Nanoarchaeota archaeon]
MARQEKQWKKWIVAALLLSILMIFTITAAFLYSIILGDTPIDGNVALISIRGVLLVDKSRGFATGQVASSSDIVDLIKAADESPNIKAMLIDINSPGGSPLASQEIADALKKSNKTIVAVIRETGASGAYWVASAADKIYASKNSIVGSIGVIGSYIEYAGLMDRYNLTYRRLVSGAYKDAGSPFKRLSDDESALIQSRLDVIYTNFVDVISTNRNLSLEKVIKIADGFVMLGEEAKQAGLIDEIGGRDEAIEYIQNKLNITAEIRKFKTAPTLADLFGDVSSSASYYIGKGLADGILGAQTESRLQFIS